MSKPARRTKAQRPVGGCPWGATDEEKEPQLKDDAGEGFGVAAAVEEAVKTPARSLKLMIFLRLRTHSGERQGWAPRRTATQTAT